MTTPSVSAAVSLLRLAAHFGHGWATYAAPPVVRASAIDSERYFAALVERFGWEATAAIIVARMLEAEADYGDQGLGPSTHHVSGSGRYAWHVRNDDTITLSVNRPNGAAVVANFNPCEGTATVEVTAEAEDRHEAYMAELLDVLGATVTWTDRAPRYEATVAPRLSVRATRDPVAFDLAAWG